MVVPLSNVRTFFGGLEGVDDSTLTIHIADAERRVVHDGVTSSHPDYENLVRYAIGISLKKVGLMSGDVEEEQVADVKVKYGAAGGTDGQSTTWEGLYVAALNRVNGLVDQIG